jgi:hypothetical protein
MAGRRLFAAGPPSCAHASGTVHKGLLRACRGALRE